MASLIDPAGLTRDQIELIEKVSMRFVYQAVRDFATEAVYIFANSPDAETEIGEDVTRELLGRMPGFLLPERIFGTMDFKRACYSFLPDFAVRQALLVDSKAEKTAAVARLQTSQTSLPIRQFRAGVEVNIPGTLGTEMILHGKPCLVTTIFIKYHYRDVPTGGRLLKNIVIAALPNGLLAAQYVPNALDTIFVAGPDSPLRGEAFRTRLSFSRLRGKCRWRVQEIPLTVAPGTHGEDQWQE